MELFDSWWFTVMGMVLLAAFARGVSGFGFSVVFAPLAILIIDPKSAIPLNLLLAQLSNVLILLIYFRKVNTRRVLSLCVGSVLGVPVGIFVILIISSSLLKILLGTVTVLSAFLLAFKVTPTPRFTNERLAGGAAGFLCGMLTTSIGIGGPPVLLFMHTQKWSKEEIYSALSAFFFVNTGASIIGLALSGLITSPILLITASLAPVLVVGVILGMWAFKYLNEGYFRTLSILLIITVGFLALLSGL